MLSLQTDSPRAVVSTVFLGFFLTFSLLLSSPVFAQSSPVHGMAMHGGPKYGPDFSHFEYANPDAPKGGHLRLSSVGSSGFDSLNPYIIKGAPAPGLTILEQNYLYDSLMAQANDEPFSMYGLIAEKMETPADRSWVIFYLNPAARFHDGEPIEADDVIYTFELLTTQGHPLYSTYYEGVKEVIAVDNRTVRFNFKDHINLELPLILGQLPVLPKHYWQDRNFAETSLEIPVGSGPYRIKDLDPGRSITYERIADYWGKDLPVNKGQYNFDLISYDHYRDENVALEAFKSGEFDFKQESVAKLWETAYSGKSFDNGSLTKELIPHELPAGMSGLIFNTRRWPFQDPLVRQALAYAFDFEWTNKQLFYNEYVRTKSYYANSDLASRDLPSPAELALLEPFREQLPEQVFTQTYQPPTTRGDGNIRAQIRTALGLLKQAGWQIRDGQLIHQETGKPLEFEIMLAQKTQERFILPFKKNLARLGVTLNVRFVDVQQYINRVNSFDFDMISAAIRQSSSPGNEQRDFWHSSEADRPGSRNWIGIKDPIVDQLIDAIISAESREALVAACRAMDRVLLWNHYVIPQWHYNYFRVAYNTQLEHPEISPKSSLGLMTWWFKPESSEGAK